MTDLPIEEIRKHVNLLVGMKCWHVGAGNGTGSSFHLALGKKVPRRVPLRKAPEGDEYREFEGEASILVWCTWRLDSPISPISSSDEGSEVLARALEILVGQEILEVVALPPAGDLCILFSNDLALRVFCDHIPGDPSFDGNWQIRVRNMVAAAGPGYQWQMLGAETRQASNPSEETTG
jgi:hypothetical protein